MSARAKAEVVVAEVEGESLEPNCVIEAEGRRPKAEVRRQANACRRPFQSRFATKIVDVENLFFQQ